MKQNKIAITALCIFLTAIIVIGLIITPSFKEQICSKTHYKICVAVDAYALQQKEAGKNLQKRIDVHKKNLRE